MFGRTFAIRSLTSKALLGAVLASTVAIAACSGTSSAGNGGNTCPSTNTLTGAGSTFDQPLFSKMFEQYPNVKCGAQVSYSPVGSGTGISQLLAGTVDFGATDAPMSDTQLSQSTNGPIVHIPVTLGAVAITYNLSQVPASTQLKFTGPLIADIYLGTVKFWDDPAITQLNPGVTLPHEAIAVVHRSDGSGTTGIFTHYLSAISPTWQSQVGAANTVNWPVGVGAKGNAGVAAQVKSTAGSIGYNELAYVLTNSIQYGVVQNAAGNYVAPSLDSAKAAAANVTQIPDDLRFYIVNAPGTDSYPISGFSWVIVYKNQKDADKGQAIANLVWWMIHDGQQYSTPLSYVPLPSTIVTKGEAQVKSLTCGSSACYKG
ncbi:MAG: phosphate ABC transporter, substrate-binding protein PstS [Ktedonobacterales bacterium]|jgi:phosphate transport system substrate-binding protein|nr:MAG: phosphate ABC transporter, substrate-binding protein PstS [Ktedonobacterales bacterium]